MNKSPNFRTLLALVLVSLFFVSCNSKQVQDFSGKWYGLRTKSLIEVTFDNGRLNVNCEDASNLCFDCDYTIDYSTSPATISLSSSGGLAAAGILRINDDGSLEMNWSFGQPRMVATPKEFNPSPKNPADVYFHLFRDKEPLMAEVNYEVDIPAEAQLAFERNRRLGAGINLNGVADGNLHPGYERDAPLLDKEIASIAEAGFRSVRFNVAWSKHCADDAPYTIDPAFMKKVQHIVDECIENDLAVVLDVHYYPYINMNEGSDRISMEDNYKRLGELWQQIATYYKDYPNDMLYFDLLNEPNLIMGAEQWNMLSAALIKVIRQTNPDRTLLVSTPDLGQSWTLNSLELPKDDWNLIVEFHYYLPHTFTHQGLVYAMAGDSNNVEWLATEGDKAPILKDLDFCKRWSEHNGRPINMGEYGVVNTADQLSRERYLGFMAEAARQRDISSHLWGYREIFMIRDKSTGEWNQPILEAMKLK